MDTVIEVTGGGQPRELILSAKKLGANSAANLMEFDRLDKEFKDGKKSAAESITAAKKAAAKGVTVPPAILLEEMQKDKKSSDKSSQWPAPPGIEQTSAIATDNDDSMLNSAPFKGNVIWGGYAMICGRRVTLQFYNQILEGRLEARGKVHMILSILEGRLEARCKPNVN
jgi:hypothetical protein